MDEDIYEILPTAKYLQESDKKREMEKFRDNLRGIKEAVLKAYDEHKKSIKYILTYDARRDSVAIFIEYLESIGYKVKDVQEQTHSIESFTEVNRYLEISW